MSTIRKHGSGWQARWRDPSGTQKKKSFDRKLDAERFLTTISAEMLNGVYTDPRAGRQTLKEYAETAWLPSLVHTRPNTRTLYEQHLRMHVLAALGSRPLGSIRKSDARRFVASLDLAPSTIHTVAAVARMVLAAAVEDGVIAVNPFSGVPLPRVEARVVEPLPAEAVLALADAVPGRYRVTVYLGAGAGLRLGEATGLTVPRIDFLRRRIHVEQQLQNGILSPLKTKASRRVVPVDDIVLEEISRHIATHRSTAPDAAVESSTVQLLVTNRLGKPVQRSSFGDCWRVAVKKAGLPEGTRFHDLRHVYASALIRAGAHPKVIQSRLGHSTISESMDVYGHLYEDAADVGRGALDGMLRPTENGIASASR